MDDVGVNLQRTVNLTGWVYGFRSHLYDYISQYRVLCHKGEIYYHAIKFQREGKCRPPYLVSIYAELKTLSLSL